MKKLAFYSMLILVFLASCRPFNPEEPTEPAPADKEMTSVTVYLDGNGPPESRAMNKSLAEMGCDYFEVVFLYNGTAVSGQWKIGERAMINGVYRDTPIDYSSVSDSPAAGTGSAILLAGKSDRTLMAIGKLPAGTVIDQNTKSVTFEVAAIKTGVSETLSESSFLTAAVYDATGNPNYSNVSAAYTETVQEDIEHLYFLAFKLKRGISGSGTSGGIKAEYTFRLDYSGTTNTAGLLSTYLSNGGLRVSAAGTVEKKASQLYRCPRL